MSVLTEDQRAEIARHLGMKASEVVAAARVKVGDDHGAVVQTHDGQRVLIGPDGAVSPWAGPMPGAPVVAEAVAEEEPPPPPAPSGGPDAVPDGTIDEVLTWVGDDRDRATRALQAEQAGKQRSSLAAQLEKLANLA